MTFDLLPTITPWFAGFAVVAGLTLVLAVVALTSIARTAVAGRPADRTAGSTSTTTRRAPVASGRVRHA